MRRIHPTAAFAVATLVALTAPATAQTGPCAGPTPPAARNLNIPAFVPGTVLQARIPDEFVTTDTRIAVYDGAGNLLAEDSGSGGPFIQDFVSVPTPITAGRYLIGVTFASNTFGANFAVTPGPVQQPGSFRLEIGAPGSPFLNFAQVDAAISPETPVLYYSFIVEAPAPTDTTDFGFINRINDDPINPLIDIDVTTDGFTPQLALYRFDGTLIETQTGDIRTDVPADLYYAALTASGAPVSPGFFLDNAAIAAAGGGYTITINNETCTGTLNPGATTWFRFQLPFVDALEVTSASLGFEGSPVVIETPSDSPLTNFAVWDAASGELVAQADTTAEPENMFLPDLPAGGYVFAASQTGTVWQENLGYSPGPALPAAPTSLSMNGVPTGVMFTGDEIEWFRGVVHTPPPASGSYAESLQVSRYAIDRFQGDSRFTTVIWDEQGSVVLLRDAFRTDAFSLRLDPGRYTLAFASDNTEAGSDFTLVNRNTQSPIVRFFIDGVAVPFQRFTGDFSTVIGVRGPSLERPANAEFLTLVVEAPTDLGTIAAGNQTFGVGAIGFPPALSRTEAVYDLATGAVIATNNNIASGVFGLPGLSLPPGDYAFAIAQNVSAASPSNFASGTYALDRPPAALDQSYTGTINNFGFGRDTGDRPMPGMFNNADFYTFRVDSCSPADTVLPVGTVDADDVFVHILQAILGLPAADLLPGDGVNIFDTIEYLRFFDEGCP
ncbi:MAG: hypothetical protein AAF235_06820 [Planctomycetota bacterium]